MFDVEAFANLQEHVCLTTVAASVRRHRHDSVPVNPIPRGAVRLDCVLGGEK